MRLSLYTLLTSSLSLEESVATAARCGFDAVDIRMRDDGIHLHEDVSDDEVKRVRALVEGAGLHVSGLTTYNVLGLVSPQESALMLEKMKRAMEICNMLGAGYVRCSGPRTDLEAGYEAVRVAFREQAPQAAAIGREHGVVVTAEQHGNLLFASAGQVLDMLRDLEDDYLGIVFDPGNALSEGYERPSVQVNMLARFIRAVHVKTATTVPSEGPSESEMLPMTAARLDKGILNWPAIIAALKAAGYDRYLTLEDFFSFETLDEKFTWDVQYLRGLM